MQIRGYEQSYQQLYQLNEQSRGVHNNLPAQSASEKDPKTAAQQSSDNKVEQSRIDADVAKLKADEQRVIAHENAHKAAGGQYAGAAQYSYTTGPDGKQYVTGGEVSIDLSKGKTPEETIAKMQQVRRAALAPADPSGQDISVAARASMIESRARMEYARNSQSQETGQAFSISA
ncbi:MAG: protein-glutamate O-methyltransferase [Nitrospirae bacterium]|nr:protein-glutamate O-methyltransferase [Nitrospirota bacterium]